MKSLWSDQEAEAFSKNDLSLRVYSSRLLGQDPHLVLYGGGNTSVKTKQKNFFNEEEEILYIKGSGWDLATIEEAGFAPVRLNTLLKLARFESLSDTDMVTQQRAAMLNPNAPSPSVEAILHALIPYKFVDHTHADSVIAITNTENGAERIRSVYGNRVLYVPYVMPGFILARKIFELTQDINWEKIEGIVLLNHGIFSFGKTAKESYERMIKLVGEADKYLLDKKAKTILTASPNQELVGEKISKFRQELFKASGQAWVCNLNQSSVAIGFSNLPKLHEISNRGPLTPDHVIHTKRVPALINGEDISTIVEKYVLDYRKYFEANKTQNMQMLDPAPRWAVWPGVGTINIGQNMDRVNVIRDISEQTMKAIQWAENLNVWKALPEKDIFEVEYWELEQAKLKNKQTSTSYFSGKIVLVTGAYQGIGRAIVNEMLKQGACVVAVDIDQRINEFKNKALLNISCDLTKAEEVAKIPELAARMFGGLDIIVSNAGIFPAGEKIESLPLDTWQKSMDVNLTSHLILMKACLPILKNGIDPSIIIMASKNVPAPGPGAAAYSAAKAGLSQLARVAALELAPLGIRVNQVHPNAVFDTGIWTEEILKNRAAHYNMSVEKYKKNNLLGREIQSKDIAQLVCAMAGPAFRVTTGAQIPADGGNDRVI